MALRALDIKVGVGALKAGDALLGAMAPEQRRKVADVFRRIVNEGEAWSSSMLCWAHWVKAFGAAKLVAPPTPTPLPPSPLPSPKTPA